MYKATLAAGYTVDIEPDPDMESQTGGNYPQFWLFNGPHLELHTADVIQFVSTLESIVPNLDADAIKRKKIPKDIKIIHTMDIVVGHFYNNDWHFAIDIYLVGIHNVQRRLAFSMLDAGLRAGDYTFCGNVMKNIFNMSVEDVLVDGIEVVH